MILRMFSSVVTVKGKQQAWEWIKRQLLIAHPDDTEKTEAKVKKNGKTCWAKRGRRQVSTLKLCVVQVSHFQICFAIFLIKLVF